MKSSVALVLLSATLARLSTAFGAPLDDVQGIDPTFDAYRDVRILLSTRQNRNNPQQLAFRNLLSVEMSHFNANRPTRVLIHGWWDDDTGDLSTETSAELLDYYDFNVLLIDYSEGRSLNWVGAVNRAPTIGAFIASYLDFLHSYGFIQPARTAVIGFSLGAHIAGFTGKSVRDFRLRYLVGLDPANLLFNERNPDGRIDAGDADYVEIIHTNGPTLVLAGAGIGAPIGDADFFPNGGTSQPGCLTNTCSHLRSVHFYVESVARNAFFSLRCPQRNDISARRCTLAPGAWMGGDSLNFEKHESGSFYLETNRSPPYAQGPVRT